MDDFDFVNKRYTACEAGAVRRLDAQRETSAKVGDDYLRTRIDILMEHAAASHAAAALAAARAAYVYAILDMPAGPTRRAQMLVDLLDVVEQTPDEDPLIAALAAYDEVRP